ncbi:glycosyltransferase family 2 protein [Lutibacter flavus]|uniref:Glycosyltransferase, GT2 family n=1 Tax=Lutibacter flavus TaxID=691689 RepID=A0A238VQM2_9FLAO|nr:glycosyltransferase [Lutibacter flavus]SNR36481.1 Glycosyltransferase, GT2 family [Lutibacter flavus]
MKFSLIICTYQRRDAIEKLLNSIADQTLYPNEIIIVDGSKNNDTLDFIKTSNFNNLHYFLVDKQNRGLTKQRNFGILKVGKVNEVVCFLDDDTILDSNYFKELIQTYIKEKNALGVGGYISNEVAWSSNFIKNGYCLDGYCRNESLRFKLRKKLGLIDETLPGYMPIYSHGRSIGFLPSSNKTYPVDFFMGGVSSYKKEVFNTIQFSTYFEGYGLYEDMDFCLRASKLGQLYVNTAAKLEHHHEAAGRPNKYCYGKMVVRNGWYVWRVKYPNPGIKAKVLFHLNVIVLLKIRFLNSFYGIHKKEAFTEALGRLVGWFSLFLNTPK